MTEQISLQTIRFNNLNLKEKINKVQNSLELNKSSSSTKNGTQLKEACSEFESFFIHHLFKEMRATIPKTGFISGGMAEEIYTSMLDSHLAKELSSKGGIGLSSLLSTQLSSVSENVENQNIDELVKSQENPSS
jgi:flagellar protein FlgJ